MPEPHLHISLGSRTCSGGPRRSARRVTDGMDRKQHEQPSWHPARGVPSLTPPPRRALAGPPIPLDLTLECRLIALAWLFSAHEPRMSRFPQTHSSVHAKPHTSTLEFDSIFSVLPNLCPSKPKSENGESCRAASRWHRVQLQLVADGAATSAHAYASSCRCCANQSRQRSLASHSLVAGLCVHCCVSPSVAWRFFSAAGP